VCMVLAFNVVMVPVPLAVVYVVSQMKIVYMGYIVNSGIASIYVWTTKVHVCWPGQ
jgi:hypothetical protein